ncbi:hypothetical protein LVJ94_06525 [Pendulispora rubella]|uniref:Uncharacterized protein n=1 Tax=Pendulispora rubella TaxID=2741070 RepID=A0ABZ2L7J3_9BACT
MRRGTKALVASLFVAISATAYFGCRHGSKVDSSGSPLANSDFEFRREAFSGRVENVLDAGSYTYFSLRMPDDRERWVVELSRSHRSASWMSVSSYGVRRNFDSPRLNRRFDELYFVSVSDSK